jgi:hypothetical protein
MGENVTPIIAIISKPINVLFLTRLKGMGKDLNPRIAFISKQFRVLFPHEENLQDCHHHRLSKRSMSRLY